MLKRVIVKQQDHKDCGLCCIQSIVKYYDGYVPIEKIRKDTFSSKRGTSAFHIVETLKNYGFDAYGTRIKKDQFKKENIPLPAIVHVVLEKELNHYMVLYEIRKDKLILMDPSCGKKSMSYTDFFWIWSEVAIITYPKNNIISYPKESNIILLMFSFLGKNRKQFLSFIYCSALLSIITLINAFFLKIELQFLNQKAENMIIGICFFILLFFQILIKKGVLNEEKNLNKKLEFNHTSNYLEHLLNLPLSFYNGREITDYFTRFWEISDLKYLYTNILKNGLIIFGTIIICFWLLFLKNKTFFLYFLGIFLLFSFYLLLNHKKCEQLEQLWIEDQNRFSKKLISDLESFEIYIHLNQLKNLKEKIDNEWIHFLRTKEQIESFHIKYQNFYYILKEGSRFLCLILGFTAISNRNLELIDFFLMESIGMNLLNSLEQWSEIFPKVHYFKHILRKAYDFLWLDQEKFEHEKEIFELGDLKLKDVTYSYNQYNYALKDLNLLIPKYTHILLMGNSGCGKSTLCKILTGILNPTYGDIKIGKINIMDYSKKTIRDNIAYLSQRSNLILGTIKENIIMNRPFDMAKFCTICEICHIEEIVQKRPLRYETIISNQENNLSGGEKQRIMLARTLISEANIYLFDESLSEVDEKLEKEIIKKIREFLKDKTIIYISHKNYKTLFDKMIKLEDTNERVLIS